MADNSIEKKIVQHLNNIRRKYTADGGLATKWEQPVNLNPIFVFQMGRVGSNSVELSLRNAYQALSLDVPIYHAHYMGNYEVIESRARHDLPDPGPLIRHLQWSKILRKTLVEDPEAPRLKLISLVRDIVARNVSTFYYALPEFVPGWKEMLNNNSLTVEYLHGVFLSKRSYEATALNWFEEQMKPVFDIDVYETPFPKGSGYKIYSTPKADLLVMRLESLNQCANQAVQEFLGLPNFELSRINTGDERKTGELQRLFKSRPLPLEYVQRMYNSRLSRHFYTDAELQAFTRYWTEEKEP
jgi:hypothetical protein